MIVNHPGELPARWCGAAAFVILDTDFGAGANFAATLQAWHADSARPRRLHYLALASALPPAPPGVAALQAIWPPALPGLHRLLLAGGAVVLDLYVGPFDASLAQVAASVDAFYVQPSVAERYLQRLRRLAAPGSPLHAAAPAQQTQQARQTTQAQQARQSRVATASPQPQRQAIVIGAGLAGAAACERLAARGWSVTLIERHAGPARQASGNLAGIFMPQLSLDDNHATRLGRAAYLFALRYWQQLGGVGSAFDGARCGVLQLARDAAHAAVQQRIAGSGRYPPEFARWLEREQAGAMLGAPAPHGGWLFQQGGWAHPAGVCAAMLDACGDRLQRIFCTEALDLQRVDGLWQVRGAGGALLAAAPVTILANGAGASAIVQAAGLPLQAVRGQVTHLDAASLAAQGWPQPALVVCREAYMTPASHGVVCVGATYDSDHDPVVRRSSQDENLGHLQAILSLESGDAAALPLAGRTGFRCVAPDRLPLVGALPDPAATAPRAERLRDVARHAGLYGLLGYASRGLTWAPLAAELLAAQLNAEPLPLEAQLATALDPARFLLKQLRRSHAAP